MKVIKTLTVKKIQILKNLILIISFLFQVNSFYKKITRRILQVNNQKLVGTNVDFEFVDNLDFPKFIEVEKDTFNDKVISIDTSKK